MLNIPVILATARKGRQSGKAADYVFEQVKKRKIKTRILDVRDFRPQATDNTKKSKTARKLLPVIESADALIIVSPEYNHSFPGELKMMLDMLYEEYFNKPAGICAVSAGPWGGARMVESLVRVLRELHMVSIRETLYFPKVQDLFDKKGKMKEQNKKDYEKRFKIFINELTWYAQALKIAKGKN